MPSLDLLNFEVPRFPIDKIVYSSSGSFALDAYTGGFGDPPSCSSTTITHNINRKCLSEMIWSTDNVNFYDGGFQTSDLVGVVQTCDTNTATIYAYNRSVLTPLTIYYTIYLIWPN